MSSLPVGTIVPFAGEPTAALEGMGWLICDGRELRRDAYAELFQALGSNFGSIGSSVFNLPDLRGYFVRCTMGKDASDPDKRDPDANGRGPLHVGGNKGNVVGTYEGYATASPKTPFQTDIVNIYEKWNDDGCGREIPPLPSSDVIASSSHGGDKETRPDNRYVAYIVKYCSKISEVDVVPPVGSVLPWAGPVESVLAGSYWLACDGTKATVADYADLYAAIGVAHGAPGEGLFNLPNYRDSFLRGMDMQSGRDPDVSARTAPAAGGNEKGNVGSVQAWATALPVTGPFTSPVSSIPQEQGGKGIDGVAKTYYIYNVNTVTVNLTAKGGDPESRPRCVGVDWIIRADGRAALPLGSIIYTGMDASMEGWMPCNGASLVKTEYQALFDLIGTTYGGSGDSFKVPDYRGYFLRGIGDKAKIGGFLDYATGLPRNPFMGVIPHLPTETTEGSGETHYNRAGRDRHGYSDRTINTCTAGGDRETRPINVYLNAYIKVSNA
jgi:microcystin-dependent protein